MSNLGINTSLSKIHLIGPLSFQGHYQVNTRYEINEMANKFLLAGDKFMPEMHLKQPGFTYSAFEPLERILKFKETGDSRYFKEIDKV